MTTRLVKKFLFGLVGAVVLVLGISMFTAATSATRFYYSITDLGSTLYSEASHSPLGINDAGQVVGARPTPTSVNDFLWSNGTMTNLTPLVSPVDINNNGQVVGRTYTISNNRLYSHASVWDKGTITVLDTTLDRESFPYSINDKGQAVGGAYTTTGFHAFLWSNGTKTQLPGTFAYDINNRGQVVCSKVLWNGDEITDLGTLGGDFTTAYGINDRGQVVGAASTSANTYHAFFWNNGAMTDLGTLGGNESTAFGINNRGQIVGRAQLSSNVYHAFMWVNGSMRDLNRLVPGYSRWRLVNAWDINNNGQIVSVGKFKDQTHAFLLTPTWVTN